MSATELQSPSSRFEKSKTTSTAERGVDQSTPEAGREMHEKGPEGNGEKAGDQTPVQEARFHFPTLHRPKKIVIPVKRDEMTLTIEKILEEGIGDSYQRLSPVAKQEFKIKGEEVAIKIRDLMSATHIKAKKIFKLIFEWLKLLPGVNRFFLEQEAKIKTDRIVQSKDRH
jgi:hypothetical protein